MGNILPFKHFLPLAVLKFLFFGVYAINSSYEPLHENEWATLLIPQSYDAQLSSITFISDTKFFIDIYFFPVIISEISITKMEILERVSHKHIDFTMPDSVLGKNGNEFEVEFFFWSCWKDHRLTFENVKNKSSALVVYPPKDILEKIWRPRLLFRNTKKSNKDAVVLDMNADYMLFSIDLRENKIIVLSRKTIKFICNYDLHNYPMDMHVCRIYISVIVRHPDIGKIYLRHTQLQQFGMSELIQTNLPPQYEFLSISFQLNCSLYERTNIKLKHECLEYSIAFRRNIANSLMMLYIPSGLIVLVSFFSFWLDVDCTSPRVALGLTSLLTLSTQFANTQKDVPSVTYVKAVDVWMISCLVFVFLSMMEYFLSYQFRNVNNVTSVAPKMVFRLIKDHRRMIAASNIYKETLSIKIDKVARILFPILFLIFNVAYWTYYTIAQS